MLLLNRPLLTFPVFAFVLVTLGLLGYRIGVAKRAAVLGMFGSQVGLAEGPVPAVALPRVLDTSVAIDGRIIDVVRSGFLHGTMLVPSPVLGELQGLADAGDDLRRAKGRRGLEILETLRREPGVEVEVLDDEVPAVPEVDAKLVRICLDRGAALLTLDTNLARVASLAGVRVMNLHALALALRPPVVAGDEVSVLLLKPGKEHGQAVGYLDDGTMVVAEHARDHIGREAAVRVTSVLTTANGRMVFAQARRPSHCECASDRARRSPPWSPAAGRGERLGAGAAKALHVLGTEPLLVHAVRALAARRGRPRRRRRTAGPGRRGAPRCSPARTPAPSSLSSRAATPAAPRCARALAALPGSVRRGAGARRGPAAGAGLPGRGSRGGGARRRGRRGAGRRGARHDQAGRRRRWRRRDARPHRPAGDPDPAGLSPGGARGGLPGAGRRRAPPTTPASSSGRAAGCWSCPAPRRRSR